MGGAKYYLLLSWNETAFRKIFWISSDGYSYSRDSVQLFGISNSYWACTWYKKNGQGFPGPFGYKLPI